MPWIQAHIVMPKAQAAFAEALLESLGALSITLEDASNQPLLEPAPGETPLWDQARITGLFDAENDAAALRQALTRGLRHLEADVTVDRLEDAPWERVWLEHFHPMRFGRRLWICPRDTAPPEVADDAVVLHMDPGMAFGTGTHETTALCLDWLDGAGLCGKRVVDYGCGSGILAVAALLLGADEVIAVDHDPQALTATRANAAYNQVDHRLRILATDTPIEPPADILVANILAGTLIQLAPALAAAVRPGGTLVLSGILREQISAVMDAYAPWIRFADPVVRNDWTLLHGVKTLG